MKKDEHYPFNQEDKIKFRENDLGDLVGRMYVLDGRLGYATYCFEPGFPYTDYHKYGGSL